MSKLTGPYIAVQRGENWTVEREYACINGLSAWFSVAWVNATSPEEDGYTDGEFPSAEARSKAIADALNRGANEQADESIVSNENELLARCPFCGGEAALTPVPTTQKADCCEVYVRCMDCDAVGPGITYEWGTEQDDPHPEAIAAWNRRAEPAPSSPVPVEAVQTVPAKPTKAMIEAGYQALMDWDARTGEDLGIWDVYSAMLSAAPAPPTGGSNG